MPFAGGGCSKDSTAEGVAEETQSGSTQIECIGGTLHFPSSKVCFETMEALTTEQARLEFEQAHNFHSMRSYIDEMYRELDACSSREEYDALLETFSDYLAYSEGRLMPRVSSVGYQRIADESGVFYVDGIKHTVLPGKILIETIDPVTRVASEEAIDYEMPFTLPSETREETVLRYTDIVYEIPDYKVFARTNVIRYVTAETVNGKLKYRSDFLFQIHTSSQERGWLGWNSYDTRFQIEKIHFEVRIGAKVIKFSTYNAWDNDAWNNSEGNYYDWYFERGIIFYVGDTVMAMPATFTCIVHRVHTNATGDCGCLTHRAPCMPLIMMPLTNCR